VTRVVVFTPRQVRKQEDAFAAVVADALHTVAARASFHVHDVLVAAGVAAIGATPQDVSVISGLWSNVVAVELAPLVGEAYKHGALETELAVGAVFESLDFEPMSDVFVDQYIKNATNRLVGIGDELWQAARESLAEGIALGETIPQLRDRVVATAGVTEKRANVIARTEVIAANNAGSLQQVMITGLTGTKEWLDTNDERTRCTHHAAGGQTVGLDGTFTLGGNACGEATASLQFPGDPTGPPGEVIQCRCSMAFDLSFEEEPLVAAAEVHTGAMIALRMTEPDARVMEVEGGEDADELHVTLCYLGDATTLTEQYATSELIDHLAEIAETYAKIHTETFALDIFNPQSTEYDTAVVLGVRGTPGMLEIQEAVYECLGELDVQYPDQHEPWIPHITLAYTDDLGRALEWMDRIGPIVFDRIRLAIAGMTWDFPLGVPLTAAGDHFDESKVKRDTHGQFAKKAGLSFSAHIFGLLKDAKDGHTLFERQTPNGMFERLRARTNPNGDRSIVHEVEGSNGDWVFKTSYGKPDQLDAKGYFADVDMKTIIETTPNTPTAPSVPLKTVPKLTNAIIYGKYTDGEVIATSGDGFFKVTFKNGKIQVQTKDSKGSWTGTGATWTKGEAYKKLQGADNGSGWVLGDQTPAVDVVPTPKPAKKDKTAPPAWATPPPQNAPILQTDPNGGLTAPSTPASSTVKLTNAVIYGKYVPGEVIATSADGKTQLRTKKDGSGKIVPYVKQPDGTWKADTPISKATAYKFAQTKGEWHLGDQTTTSSLTTEDLAAKVVIATEVSDPGVPPLATPSIHTLKHENVLTEKLMSGYSPGQIIAYSDDSKTRIIQLNDLNKVGVQFEDPDSPTGWSPTQIRTKAYMAQHGWSYSADGWIFGGHGKVDPNGPDMGSSALPTTTAPSITHADKMAGIKAAFPGGSHIVPALGSDFFHKSYQDNEVVAFSNDGEIKVTAQIVSGKTVFKVQSRNDDGSWSDGINYPENMALGQIGPLSGGWVVPSTSHVPPVVGGDEFAAILPNSTEKFLLDTAFFNQSFSSGQIVAYSDDGFTRIVMTDQPDIFAVQSKSISTGIWSAPASYTKAQMVDFAINSPNSSWIIPNDVVGVSGFKTASSPTASTPVVPAGVLTVAVQDDIIKSFIAEKVKWHNSGETVVALALKKAHEHGLSLGDVLSTMDSTTKTSTSKTPYTDKVTKLLQSSTGKQKIKTIAHNNGLFVQYATLSSPGNVKPQAHDASKVGLPGGGGYGYGGYTPTPSAPKAKTVTVDVDIPTFGGVTAPSNSHLGIWQKLQAGGFKDGELLGEFTAGGGWHHMLHAVKGKDGNWTLVHEKEMSGHGTITVNVLDTQEDWLATGHLEEFQKPKGGQLVVTPPVPKNTPAVSVALTPTTGIKPTTAGHGVFEPPHAVTFAPPEGYPQVTPDKMTSIQDQMFSEHGKWTAAQKAALRVYTGSSTSMNGCLRQPQNCSAHIKKQIEDATAGMRPTPVAIRTVRGTGIHAFPGTSGKSAAEALAFMQAQEGRVLREPGFLSTAVSGGFSGQIHWQIDIPEGTPIAWVQPISHYPSENEVLLPPGLKYRIKKVAPPSGGHAGTLVVLEVIYP
jgi:2'-5' RNA ligase